MRFDVLQELEETLKGDVLDELLRRQPLGDGVMDAIKQIARLPSAGAMRRNPGAVDWDSLRSLIEFLAEILGGLLARKLRMLHERLSVEEVVYSDPRGSGPPSMTDLRDLMMQNNAMLFSMRQTLNQIVVDRSLKSLCPFCFNDLKVVIKDKGVGVPGELRLQCEQQKNKDCKTVDWYIIDVDRVKP